MLKLIPAPLHRLALRIGYRLRKYFWKLARPDVAGVAVLLRDADGRLLLVRHSYGPRSWAIPGGGMRANEDPAEAARREMREELGCELAELRVLQVFDENLSGAPHRAHVYTATTTGEPRIDGRELLEARWFAAEELTTISCTRVTFKRLKTLGFYSSES
ncbi:NUDIX hydrolase [Erythrobacter alti]|uniref:NUDIX hydrolase n=1 Tax=Erythrobacter alti TaxID=1896145 RepID=UPI0030F38F3D